MIVADFNSEKGGFGLSIGLKEDSFDFILSKGSWTTLINSSVESLEVALADAKNDTGIIEKESQFLSVQFDHFTPAQFEKFLDAVNAVSKFLDNTL